MKIARNERSLVVWILYGCILFSAFTCAISHGQMAGSQLAGLDGQSCSIGGNFEADAQFDDSGLVTPITATDSTCVLVSTVQCHYSCRVFLSMGFTCCRPDTASSQRETLATKSVLLACGQSSRIPLGASLALKLPVQFGCYAKQRADLSNKKSGSSLCFA